MTITKIRARLERLEVSAKVTKAKVEEKKLPFGFPIDPAVVQAIKDEYEFLQHAGISRYFAFGSTDFNTPDEIQTRARIAALASTINCPPSYGFKEYWADEERRLKLFPVEESLSALESAQARARMEAYEQTPEGKGRLRLHYLESGLVLLGPAGYEEMERLIKLYPEPWCQPEVSGLVEYFFAIERYAQRPKTPRGKTPALDQRKGRTPPASKPDKGTFTD